VQELTADQQAMVEANLGLAGWAVNRYASHLPQTGSTYTQEDAYQDAIFGLVTAVRKYNPDLGFTFSTYAHAWLRQAIQRGRGTAEGSGWRRAQANGHLPPLTLSLDYYEAKVDELGHTHWAPLLVDQEASDAFLVVDSDAATVTICEHAVRVCSDDIDRDLVDTITSDATGVALSGLLQQVADRHGLSREACRRRWKRIARDLRSMVGDDPR
jgi:RNA polymerase sigma factor (sigma-70 family)